MFFVPYDILATIFKPKYTWSVTTNNATNTHRSPKILTFEVRKLDFDLVVIFL